MLVGHIRYALVQVQELQQKILEKQRFKGYSGRARAIAGTIAFLAAAILASPYYPRTVVAHILGWGIVFMLALILNFGAMLYWFLFDPAAKRDFRRLKPIIDAFPPLFVGAVLTYTMIRHGSHQYLFGIWMCLFGLTNLAMRHVLPRRIWLLGLSYILCGAICLVIPVSFLNPWPMGITFLIGEWAAGFILHFDDMASASFKSFLKEGTHVEIG